MGRAGSRRKRRNARRQLMLVRGAGEGGGVTGRGSMKSSCGQGRFAEAAEKYTQAIDAGEGSG